MKKLIVVMLAVGLLASLAQAGVTGANIVLPRDITVLTDGDPATWYAESGYVDGQWRDRSLDVASPWAGVDGILPQSFLAQSSYGEEARTTISGLTEGETYYFWILTSVALDLEGGLYGGKSYDIMAAFDGDTLAAYGYSTGTNTGLVSRAESNLNYTVFENLMGSVTVGGSGSVTVVFDYADLADRTIYHGIAYDTVPEPATMVLLSFGGLALLRKRR